MKYHLDNINSVLRDIVVRLPFLKDASSLKPVRGESKNLNTNLKLLILILLLPLLSSCSVYSYCKYGIQQALVILVFL